MEWLATAVLYGIGMLCALPIIGFWLVKPSSRARRRTRATVTYLDARRPVPVRRVENIERRDAWRAGVG